MKKIDKTNLILTIISLILILINLSLYLNFLKKEKSIASRNDINNQTEENNEQSNEKITEKSEEELAQEELEKLQKMTERDRMEYYFSKFVKYIKDEKYTEAYNLLYPEFREKYFKTQEEFRDYAKKTYPRSTGFSYNDIERQGSIYVLVITVIDTNKKIGEEKSQRIVIQENDFNDFVLSFQVI